MKTVIILAIAFFICGGVFSEEAQLPTPTDQEWVIYRDYQTGIDDDYRALSSIGQSLAIQDLEEKYAKKYDMTPDEIGKIVARCVMVELMAEYKESLKENP